MKQPILNSPQDLGKRRKYQLSLGKFHPILESSGQGSPLHYVPIQPAVCLVPTCQEGLICILNLDFAARKTMISTRLIWSKVLGQSPTFHSCSLGKEITPRSSLSPILHLTAILSFLSNASVQPQTLPWKASGSVRLIQIFNAHIK